MPGEKEGEIPYGREREREDMRGRYNLPMMMMELLCGAS